jgi:hypothetical protein
MVNRNSTPALQSFTKVQKFIHKHPRPLAPLARLGLGTLSGKTFVPDKFRRRADRESGQDTFQLGLASRTKWAQWMKKMQMKKRKLPTRVFIALRDCCPHACQADCKHRETFRTWSSKWPSLLTLFGFVLAECAQKTSNLSFSQKFWHFRRRSARVSESKPLQGTTKLWFRYGQYFFGTYHVVKRVN